MSWFPFFLFDTDWMGREVFHGNPKGNPSEIDLYDQGVREGAFGLLLNSVRTEIEHLNFDFQRKVIEVFYLGYTEMIYFLSFTFGFFFFLLLNNY